MTQPSNPLAADETDRLIASDKVAGTAVYNRQGERLGSIERVMIDKVSGQVPYAVLALGGVRGVGERQRFYPLPWRALSYDAHHAGYVVDISWERLQAGPGWTGADGTDWAAPAFGRHINEFYGFY